VRRPFGVEISPEDRALAREFLRNPTMSWESPADAREHYANAIAAADLAGINPPRYWLYAYAVAARLHDVQVRRAFPPKPVPQ
jgi:hypothetical protein